MPEISTTPNSAVSSPNVLPVEPQKLSTMPPMIGHVLSNDQHIISLSLPGQPVLLLDITDNKLAQQLTTGQQVQVTIKQIDQQQLIITLSKVTPTLAPVAEIPLSRDLALQLATSTNLPSQLSDQLRYIEAKAPLDIGQARRLPNETLKLITPNLVNITASLPGASLIDLNQTYSLALIVMKNNSAFVQFTPLPAKEAPIVIQSSLTDISKKSPLIDLGKLISTPSAAVMNTLPTMNSVEQPMAQIPALKVPKIDMSSPRIQLWLKHQPLSQVMSQLTEATKDVAQLKLPLSVNIITQSKVAPSIMTPQQPLNTSANQGVVKLNEPPSQIISHSIAPKAESLSLEKLPSIAIESATAAPRKVTSQYQPSLITQPASETIKLPNNNNNNNPSNSSSNQAAQRIVISSPPTELVTPALNHQTKSQIQPQIQHSNVAAATELTQSQTKETLINSSKLQPAAIANSNPVVSSTPMQQKPLHAEVTSPMIDLITKSSSQILSSTAPTTTTPTTATATAPNEKVSPAELATKIALSQERISSPLAVTNNSVPAKPTDNALTNTPGIDAKQVTANQQNIATTEQPEKQLKSHLSLQKLNALLASINTSQAPQTPSETKQIAATATQPVESQAILKLQSLTKQLQHSLPNMQQLTTAPILPNLIEQFVRFDPLSPSSINLTNLGPLAGALQLLLGGRAANSTTPLGPILSAQLKKILSSHKQTTSQNLAQSLAQLNQHPSFKSLEEVLVTLSGHIQLYQYQSQEQTSTNQQVFFFTLPTSEPAVPQVEGQIEQQCDPDEPTNKSWKLTLLLPIGATEKLQASANLQGSNVEIELTCENNEILNKAEFFSDFLRQRLETLGLKANDISCKHAPLPKSLLQRPNQLVELVI